MAPMWREETAEQSLEKAREKARKGSENCGGCVQHINKRPDGTYYVSDWYDADSTVASYVNGKEKT